MITTYLIKSTLCLAVLFGFYKIVLEAKALHHFKRYYLLASLIFSLTIPLITFTYTTTEAPQEIWIGEFAQAWDQTALPTQSLPVEEKTNYLPYILWAIYGLGTLIFGGRFLLNLIRLKRKITTAETHNHRDFTLALLQQSIIPHSFLKYIFLSRKRYENKEIPSEVIAHEATHVRQKHSLDILFIEFLQVVFWFNPLFWMTKKSITLNHEFLADQGAIQEQHDIYQYQHILLNYASSAHHTTLESPFNYSSTKKRILMLSQSFNRKRLALSALLLIPIIAGCILVFNQGIIAQPSDEAYEENADPKIYARSIELEITSDGNYIVDELKTTKNDLQKTLASLHTDLTKEQRDRVINIHVSSEKNIPYEDLVFIQKVAKDYGYHRIVTPEEEIIRSKGNVPMIQNTAGTTTSSAKNITLEIIEYGKYRINGKAATNENFSEVLHTFNADLTKEERQNTVNVTITAIGTDNMDQVKEIRDRLVDYGIKQLHIPRSIIAPNQTKDNYLASRHPSKQDMTRWLDASQYGVWLDGVQIKNDVLKKYHPDDLPYFIESKLEKNAYNYGKHYVQVNIMTNPYWQEKRGVGFPSTLSVDLNTTKGIRLKPVSQQQQSSQNYATEYVKGAERNGKKAFVIEIKNNKVFVNGKASSVNTLRSDIDAITKGWEETDYTESYPSILVKNPDKGFLKKLNAEFLKTNYSKANGGMELLPPPPPPAPPAPKAPSQLPPPPPPPSVEEHLKSMNDIGGVFYYEDKQVTFEKAVSLVKANENLNVQTRHPYTTAPKTYISAKPIVVEVQEQSKKPVTKKDISVYNKLAKKYGKNPEGKILKSEVAFMYEIYSRMTKTQKKNAEPYPALPPPPPPAPVKIEVKEKKSKSGQEMALKIIPPISAKDTKFSYQGKVLSTQEALDYLSTHQYGVKNQDTYNATLYRLTDKEIQYNLDSGMDNNIYASDYEGLKKKTRKFRYKGEELSIAEGEKLLLARPTIVTGRRLAENEKEITILLADI
ncbi:hypothetical protein GCM10011344_16840 [Dokdonia pacifica]|uniref:Signal transducer regulating beta-lactamase production, contains metallopeptidase domain n=1 Tax=Dokdonia pacifica TaxID=1627892 RepID=A0A238VX36_9FLAO|nr:M56 family metallopeptidase [Dokdonia pacifica]GGG16854.1 hypothetical protein GCM10011344_16840 [Dokdonia pacifica]SNR38741.1 Signal transducer regulating beta-lactamase production, contains metallopeptidase domain [Dokdonia pacifica]